MVNVIFSLKYFILFFNFYYFTLFFQNFFMVMLNFIFIYIEIFNSKQYQYHHLKFSLTKKEIQKENLILIVNYIKKIPNVQEIFISRFFFSLLYVKLIFIIHLMFLHDNNII